MPDAWFMIRVYAACMVSLLVAMGAALLDSPPRTGVGWVICASAVLWWERKITRLAVDNS